MMSLRHVGLRSYAGVMGRTLGRFVAVLLVVGFVGAYFWWIAAIAAVAALIWMARQAFRSVEAIEAEDDERAKAEARRLAAVARRADQQHAWVIAGDERGVYGAYPPMI
jgi:nitrate/nitrite transporter NarK